MVGLTYTPPLLPSQEAAAVPADGNAPVVAEVLSARTPGAIQDTLSETLQAASGPGNVITGTVTATASDGSVTLTTANGTQISLHHPPELPLNLGSSVTLRLATGGATPQATILQVDGRPVVLRPGATQPTAPGAAPVLAASALRGGPLPGADSASAYAATLAAVISLEDQALIGTILGDGDPGVTGPAAAASDDVVTQALLAVLIRAAPAKLGQAPLPAGTRYLLVPLSADEEVTEDSLSDLLPASVPDEEAADFTPQGAVLAGRVLPSSTGETLVETAIGTLSLGTGLSLPPGTGLSLPPGMAIRLRVAAVALPRADAGTPGSDATQRGLIDEIVGLLGGETRAETPPPALAGLMLMPGDGLFAALWAFMADPGRAARARDALVRARLALAEAGRPDLAERLEQAGSEIGGDLAGVAAEGWIIATLPFLGANERPARLYTKPPEEREANEGQQGGGHRFVLEVELVRLGPLQFDGLVRDQRFDLMLRSAVPLEAGLAATIETVFRDAVGACGWTGEIAFGRIQKFPLVPPSPPHEAVAFSV